MKGKITNIVKRFFFCRVLQIIILNQIVINEKSGVRINKNNLHWAGVSSSSEPHGLKHWEHTQGRKPQRSRRARNL